MLNVSSVRPGTKTKRDPDMGVTACAMRSPKVIVEPDRGPLSSCTSLGRRRHVQEHEVDGIKHLVIAVRAQVNRRCQCMCAHHFLSTQEDAFARLHENFTASKA